MASIHRKSKDGTWYITYRQNGKSVHRSLATTSERKALQLKREVELILEKNGFVEVIISTKPRPDLKNPCVDEFWDDFCAWANEHRAAGTVAEYTIWFNQFKRHTGMKRMGDPMRSDVESFKTKLLRQGKHKPKGVGLSKVSINNALKTLKSIWNQAKKLGLYSGENPFAEVEFFKIPQRNDRSYLEKDQVESLMKASKQYAEEYYVKQIEARNVRIAIALMAFAGLRRKEVCFARWEWIQWEKKILVVTSSDEFTTKNKRSRIISMHQELIDIIMPFRKESGYILESTRSNENKNRYRSDFRKAFQRVCEIANIEATPHDLRHSFASRHAIKGRSLHVIAGWLGHSTTWITERYAHYQQRYNEDVNDM